MCQKATVSVSEKNRQKWFKTYLLGESGIEPGTSGLWRPCARPLGKHSCTRTRVAKDRPPFADTENFVFWHVAELSARQWVEMNRTDSAHLSRSAEVRKRTMFFRKFVLTTSGKGSLVARKITKKIGAPPSWPFWDALFPNRGLWGSQSSERNSVSAQGCLERLFHLFLNISIFWGQKNDPKTV